MAGAGLGFMAGTLAGSLGLTDVPVLYPEFWPTNATRGRYSMGLVGNLIRAGEELVFRWMDTEPPPAVVQARN